MYRVWIGISSSLRRWNFQQAQKISPQTTAPVASAATQAQRHSRKVCSPWAVMGPAWRDWPTRDAAPKFSR